MKEKVTFYRCEECGNTTGVLDGNSKNILCCGKKMKPLVANSTDAATEKHVPVYEVDGNEIVVRVGEVEHPMEEDHYIMWIAQVSENRTERVRLHPGQATETRFPYIKGSVLYEYCNKHGLWKKEVE